MYSDYKISHVNTCTAFVPFLGDMRLISETTVDVFKDHNDPDHFVKFKEELFNSENIFAEIVINLN
jgi:hypothetical protein